MDEAKRVLGDKIEYSDDQYGTLVDADALLLVTEWSEFLMPNLKVVKKLLNKPVIFDGRNIYDPEEIQESKIDYFGIGRK